MLTAFRLLRQAATPRSGHGTMPPSRSFFVEVSQKLASPTQALAIRGGADPRSIHSKHVLISGIDARPLAHLRAVSHAQAAEWPFCRICRSEGSDAH